MRILTPQKYSDGTNDTFVFTADSADQKNLERSQKRTEHIPGKQELYAEVKLRVGLFTKA
jgi:hypothetical protein